MSWSMSSIAVPLSTIVPQSPAELLALRGVQAGRRLVEADHVRLRRQRARHADQLALTLRELARRARRRGRPAAGASAPTSTRSSSSLVPRKMSRSVSRHDARRAATMRFSRTVRSSNSSAACHVRVSPRWARSAGAMPVMSVPSRTTLPVLGDEPRDRVDERRLACAVRADQPDELALLDLQVDVAEGVHAAEADGQPSCLEQCAHRWALPAAEAATPPPLDASAAASCCLAFSAAFAFFFWYCDPAIPSGKSRRQRISVTPATSSVHVRRQADLRVEEVRDHALGRHEARRGPHRTPS